MGFVHRHLWLLALVGVFVCLGCKSKTSPSSSDYKVLEHDNAADVQPSAQHDCAEGELSQLYMVDIARMEGERSAYLNYCFVNGYRGIGCHDDGTVTMALGHSLSNRERADCDAIVRRIEHRQKIEEARKKRLDEAYDKRHGLKSK